MRDTYRTRASKVVHIKVFGPLGVPQGGKTGKITSNFKNLCLQNYNSQRLTVQLLRRLKSSTIEIIQIYTIRLKQVTRFGVKFTLSCIVTYRANSYFRHLLKNFWPNFDQTCYARPLWKGHWYLYKLRGSPLWGPQGAKECKIRLNIKNIVSVITMPIA